MGHSLRMLADRGLARTAGEAPPDSPDGRGAGPGCGPSPTPDGNCSRNGECREAHQTGPVPVPSPLVPPGAGTGTEGEHPYYT